MTDLKQWAYCPRIVYFQQRMPGVGKQTYKMGEGKAAQDMIEQLEMRRTLREYGFEGAVRKFGVWLQNDDLGLAGKLDLLLEMATEAAIVEFKLTSGEVGQNHRLQLGGYSLLVEAETGKAVRAASSTGFRTGAYFRFPLMKACGVRSGRPWIDMRKMISAGWLPEPTDVRKRCEECEYANYCGDVW